MRFEAGAYVELSTDSHVNISGADFGVGPILAWGRFCPTSRWPSQNLPPLFLYDTIDDDVTNN